MLWTLKLMFLGVYLSAFPYSAHSFVLLTANVEDLKRIAQKLVSDSLADKIAKFLIEATDNKIEFDNGNATRNLSEYNDDFVDEKTNAKPEYIGEFRQKTDTKTKQHQKQIKQVSSTIKTTPKIVKEQKNPKKFTKKKQLSKSRSKPKKEKKTTTEQYSLEYYRSDKRLNKINPNSIIDLDKINVDDDSSTANMIRSRKEFENIDSFDKSYDPHNLNDKIDSNIHKYIENISRSTKQTKGTLGDESDDFNYSNKLDTKSDESSKTNLTTELERNEFDQYFNTNYPKADVLATSGPLELTKSTKKILSDTEYN